MADKAIRVPVEYFIDRFWPIPHASGPPPIPTHNPFAEVGRLDPKTATEDEYSAAFIEALESSNDTLTPGMKARRCCHKKDEGGTTMRVDGAIYRSDNIDAPVPDDNRPHYADQIVAIEFKRSKLFDPFSDKGDPCPESIKRRDVRGQISSYAENALSTQRRVGLFMLVVIGRRCRLTRWDRSGVVFTVSFDYCDDWQLFCQVLWRMSQCSDEQLGFDPTARRIYPSDPLYKVMDDEAEPRESDVDHQERDLGPNELPPGQPFVFRYVREKFRESLSNGAPRYLLDVPDGNTIRQYLVGRAAFIAKGMAGRGTQGFAALDRETKQLAWLKDCWRADYALVEHEGDILRELNKAGVPNIPTLICYGDIPNQKTVTPEVWRWAQKEWVNDPTIDLAIRIPESLSTTQAREELAKTLQASKQHVPGDLQSTTDGTGNASQVLFDKDCPLRLHQHARIVVKEIGLPLKDFETGGQLLYVVGGCLGAHYIAATLPEPISRIHRDISSNNILIVPMVNDNGAGIRSLVWNGLLCDWELSKRIKSTAISPRQPVRSGTWQYMSVALLDYHDKVVEICDELEAFLHVIVYHAVRYLDSNLTKGEVGQFIEEYFDQFRCYNGVWHCGERKRNVLQWGALMTGTGKTIEFDSPMDAVLKKLLPWFQGNYIVQKYNASVAAKPPPSSPTLTRPSLTRPPLPPKAVVSYFAPCVAFNRKRARSESPRADVDQPRVADPVSNAPIQVPSKSDVDNAQQVQTHDAFIELLLDVDPKTWPDDHARPGDRYPTATEHGTRYIRRGKTGNQYAYVGELVKRKERSSKARAQKRRRVEGSQGPGADVDFESSSELSPESEDSFEE
ncbi:hypothetical protein GY45DRAFT_606762 [Cubamyces sp. BRFM 1775]|nr:hypothetical protein GY45DRAFT_606762 [Cubamyces sp. BRFM 1775]